MTVSEAPRATQGSGPESAAGTAIVEQPTSATARRGHPRPGEPVRALAMVLGLTAGLSLILALFVGIAINSGPNGVRLAVAGPAPAVQQITAALTQAGGPDAFDVTVVGDEAAARAALDEAQQIAERGLMPLYLADIHLHRAGLFRDRAPLADARTLIQTHGYGRRLEELADAEAAA